MISVNDGIHSFCFCLWTSELTLICAVTEEAQWLKNRLSVRSQIQPTGIVFLKNTDGTGSAVWSLKDWESRLACLDLKSLKQLAEINTNCKINHWTEEYWIFCPPLVWVCHLYHLTSESGCSICSLMIVTLMNNKLLMSVLHLLSLWASDTFSSVLLPVNWLTGGWGKGFWLAGCPGWSWYCGGGLVRCLCSCWSCCRCFSCTHTDTHVRTYARAHTHTHTHTQN